MEKQKLRKQKAEMEPQDGETTGLRGKSRNAESGKQKCDDQTAGLRDEETTGRRDYGDHGAEG
jgi:hypothetical protein